LNELMKAFFEKAGEGLKMRFSAGRDSVFLFIGKSGWKKSQMAGHDAMRFARGGVLGVYRVAGAR
jgi:hypothetical protein